MKSGNLHLVLTLPKIVFFIDEAGFNLHIQRGRDRSLKGTPAKGIVPTARGVTITILGAISEAGVIDISLKKPQAVAMSKKRKGDDKVVNITNARIGTRTEHYLTYLSNVMDVLDRHSMKGYYLVLDNAPIHTPTKVRELCGTKRLQMLVSTSLLSISQSHRGILGKGQSGYKEE